MPQVLVFPDADALHRAAAEEVVATAAQACAVRGRFIWCVSGGNTPRAVYELLATDAFASRIDWARMQLFFGDERCVAPTDAASNYRMVWQALVRHVPLAPEHIHRIAGEELPPLAAQAYEARLRALLGVFETGAPATPFDLVLLGMGSDGHTASLFPGSVDEPGCWVSARAALPVWRVTLTPLVLNAARAASFLVAGPDKAERLEQVLACPPRPTELPAQRIAPAGPLRWLIDRAAAARLDPQVLSSQL